jgi:NAD(P)-dependent dehydrogenase (short-subunit alcohol dehydrogenase family)
LRNAPIFTSKDRRDAHEIEVFVKAVAEGKGLGSYLLEVMPATAARVVEAALSRFRSIDVLVNNAGIFFTKDRVRSSHFVVFAFASTSPNSF